MHVGKSRRNCFVADEGISFLQIFYGQLVTESSRGSDFEPILIQGNLDFPMPHVGSMADGIRNHFPDTVYGEFVDILPIDSINTGAHADMLHYEICGVFHLDIKRSIDFLSVKKD